MELFDNSDNFRTGYIKIFRSVRDHYLFNEKLPYSKFEAWIDILLKVNHEAKKVSIKGVVFTVNRGETLRSLETWATAWRWDKSKVRRFLDLLLKEKMIELINETKSTRLIVCKYDSYQSFGNADETLMKRKRHAGDTLTTPNKEAKKIIDFKIDIKDRKILFKEEIRNFEKYFDTEMLNNFYIYWAEVDKTKSKMKWEMEKTWELDLRLERWKNNNFNNGSQNNLPDRGALKAIHSFSNTQQRKP